MKTLFLWLALVVVGIAAALFFGRSRVETGSANRAWPLGLGVMAEAPKRFPVTKDNAAAAKLTELARAADIDLRSSRMGDRMTREEREAVLDYLRVQLTRTGDAIDAPPSAVAEYLKEHAAKLDEIKALALSGEPIVFAADIHKQPLHEAPGPNIVGLQHLQRLFAVRALDRARSGNADAWDELRAAWELVRPLWNRPDPTAVVSASSGARVVNGVARKMPLPPPAWFREVDTFPYERALAAAMQASAWRGKTAALDVRLRSMAEEVLRAKACDSTSPQFDAVREKLDARATPSLMQMWERLMRFRAEREATQRVLQMRAGQTPSRDSQCSDGSWEVTPASFRFTRPAPVPEPQLFAPLEYSRAR